MTVPRNPNSVHAQSSGVRIAMGAPGRADARSASRKSVGDAPAGRRFGYDCDALPLERSAHGNHAGGKTELRDFDEATLVSETYGRNDRRRDPQAVERYFVFVGPFVAA